jgi:zinc transporter, ZIP family
MTSLLATIILFSLAPVLTMVGGGVGAIIRKPNGNVRSLILHFAAGVIFSVVAVEILPVVIKEHKPIQIIIGFVLGFLTMTFLRYFTEKKENTDANTGSLPMSLLVGISVDIFIDGLLLGIGFAAGNKTGMLLSFALSIEFLSLGMATATELENNHIAKSKSLKIIIGLAFIFLLSAFLGGTLLQNMSGNVIEIVLSFGLSALLFLVTEELLIEAHEEKETIWHTSSFFIGFLLFLILGLVF